MFEQAWKVSVQEEEMELLECDGVYLFQSPEQIKPDTGWASASVTGFIDLELVKYSDGLLPVLPIHCLCDTPKWVQRKSHNNWGFFWAEEMLVDKFPWF